MITWKPQGQAQPQCLKKNCQEEHVWPEHWGMTTRQLRTFVDHCRRRCDWERGTTMRMMVDRYIKPCTEGTGLGFALLVNQDAPKEVTCMVSHSWNEDVVEFTEALERSLHPDEGVFICAFSIFQNEDGSGPSIAAQLGNTARDSPFYRVMDRIHEYNAQGGWCRRHYFTLTAIPALLLCASLMFFAAPIFRDWCIPTWTSCYCEIPQSKADQEDNWPFVVSFMSAPATPFHSFCFVASILCLLGAITLQLTLNRLHIIVGRMLAVPNRQDDLYSRLWCVYEIFVAAHILNVPVRLANTFAFAGKCSSRDATCSCPMDVKHIRGEIEDWAISMGRDPSFGYCSVDQTIAKVTREAKMIIGRKFAVLCYMLAGLCALNTDVPKSEGPTQMSAANSMGTTIGFVFLIAIVFFAVQRVQGRPTFGRLCRATLILLGTYVCYIVIHIVLSLMGSKDEAKDNVDMFFRKFANAPSIGSEYLVSYLAAIWCCHRMNIRGQRGRCLKKLAVSVVLLLNLTLQIKQWGLPGSLACAYPWFVLLFTKQASLVGTLAIGSWACSHWGIRVRFEHTTQQGRRIMQTMTFNDIDSLFSSSCAAKQEAVDAKVSDSVDDCPSGSSKRSRAGSGSSSVMKCTHSIGDYYVEAEVEPTVACKPSDAPTDTESTADEPFEIALDDERATLEDLRSTCRHPIELFGVNGQMSNRLDAVVESHQESAAAAPSSP